jgi:hypothetical protein
VAIEDDYRAYRGVISAAIRVLRPHVKAEPVRLDALALEIGRFSPQLVVCTWPNTVDPGGIPAWVELSMDHSQPTRVCVGGHYVEHPGPLALEALLEVVDDVERLSQAQSYRKGC